MTNIIDDGSSPSHSRRAFLKTGTVAAAALSFTIVPRHVLGGVGYIAPSERRQSRGHWRWRHGRR